jgi:hypothetical protein
MITQDQKPQDLTARNGRAAPDTAPAVHGVLSAAQNAPDIFCPSPISDVPYEVRQMIKGVEYQPCSIRRSMPRLCAAAWPHQISSL